MDFQYYLPVNVVFGCGRAAEAGAITAKYGSKALIVTGKSSAKRSGLYDRVKNSLDAAGVASVLFDKVSQNPLTTTAEEGAKAAKENDCDVIVAIGGGSIMDCAKGIAFLAENDGDINDYIFARISSEKALPLVLIPTTCGTGSEGNGFAVLTNPETGDKKSLRCSAIVAKASIVDPECMQTMPSNVLASVGFDALCHCIEAYTANNAQPFTDALSLYAIEQIADTLVPLYTKRDDSIMAWEKLTVAATIGGMVIGMAGVTLAHGMEHPASGLKNIVHGQGLAAITPPVVEYIWKGNPEKFARISRLLGGTGAEDCADAIRDLLRKLDLQLKLGDLGLSETDIPWMTQNCLKVSAGNLINTPVPVDEQTIRGIYARCF